MNANTTPPPADGSGQNRSVSEPAQLLRSPFAPGPEVREVGAAPPEDQEPSGLETLIERFRPGGAANLLLVMILLFTVAAVTWAAVTELDRTVRATGRVIPLGRLQVVSNQEGGIVSEILVETGDLVDKGQPMVLLDLTEAGSDLQSKQATLDALNAKIARLEAEIAGRRPVYPLADNPETAAQIRIEQSLHAARLAELADAESVARARIGQAQRSVTQAEAALAGRRTAAQLARSEADTIAGLVAKGIEPRLAGQQAEVDHGAGRGRDRLPASQESGEPEVQPGTVLERSSSGGTGSVSRSPPRAECRCCAGPVERTGKRAGRGSSVL